ncbi:MAG: alpha-L-arabinofuranosidase [Nostocaceae cyanobacterium]|nr:alpha-L-arabinofuranosidase [Nostocaceae cyanobacterium]
MRRRDLLLLGLSSAALVKVLEITSKSKLRTSASASTRAQITVDWASQLAKSTPFTFGSNDYEITIPERAADTVFQNQVRDLGIRLIRVHHADLSDRWSNPNTKTWDITKIQAGYEVSYPHKPTIIQNIPRWPKWMKQNSAGLLDPSEYDNYATFCATLVEILNRRLGRQIIYWEPMNELDVRYQQAGKLDQLWVIYNKVAQKMKSQDSKIKVGGPALTWDDPQTLSAFLQACKPNVDFISWHRYGSGNVKDSTNQIMSFPPRYGDQVRLFRNIASQYIPERKIPLLLGEYNINYSWQSGENRQNTYIGAAWFASVLKNLAESGIEMATSWHLKDQYYGMIDPQNNLRPAAIIFQWANKYLTGAVMETTSDNALVEALAVKQSQNASLLLINKSSSTVQLTVKFTGMSAQSNNNPMFITDANGVKNSTFSPLTLASKPLILNPYSVVLLRV